MRISVPLLMVVVSACASGAADRPTRPATETVRVVDGSGQVTRLTIDAARPSAVFQVELSVEDAWRALPAAYETLGIPIADIDAGARLLGNRNIEVRRRLGDVRLGQYLDCGRTQGGPSADTYQVHLAVQTRLQQVEAGTSSISTVVEATARPVNFAAHSVRCSSTGRLERRIAEELESRAQQVSRP